MKKKCQGCVLIYLFGRWTDLFFDVFIGKLFYGREINDDFITFIVLMHAFIAAMALLNLLIVLIQGVDTKLKKIDQISSS